MCVCVCVCVQEWVWYCRHKFSTYHISLPLPLSLSLSFSLSFTPSPFLSLSLFLSLFPPSILPSRHKFQSKLKEAEEALEALQAKHSALEKTKSRIAAELEDSNLDLEKVSTTVMVLCYHTCTCTYDRAVKSGLE